MSHSIGIAAEKCYREFLHQRPVFGHPVVKGVCRFAKPKHLHVKRIKPSPASGIGERPESCFCTGKHAAAGFDQPNGLLECFEVDIGKIFSHIRVGPVVDQSAGHFTPPFYPERAKTAVTVPNHHGFVRGRVLSAIDGFQMACCVILRLKIRIAQLCSLMDLVYR